VEYPDGFPANKFMVNIGLALKELLPEEEEANFSIVNFNALPEVYLPKAISLSRILAPVGIVAGIGLLICMGFLIQSGSAHTAVLRSQLASTESRVVQQRAGIAALQGQVEQVGAQIELVGAQIEPVEATAGVFSSTLTELEQRREEIDADLSQIVSLVPAGVDLTRVTHGGDSVKVGGTVPYENDIFGYARDLRSGGRFSVVIISSIKVNVSEERLKGRQFDFEFCLIK
jgi:Tfp pilus assembly protein PilN